MEGGDIIIGLIAFCAIIYSALEQYGFDKAMYELKMVLFYLIIIGIISAVLIFASAKISSFVKRTEEIPIPAPEVKEDDPPHEVLEDEEDNAPEEELSPSQDEVAQRKLLEEVFSEPNEIDPSKYRFLRPLRKKTFLNPITNKREIFKFRKNGNEGDNHFLMTKVIADFLKGKVDKIELFQTVKPDIVFQKKKKNIAIEVETGKVLKKDKRKLRNKVKNLNKYYDDWFFVVTDKNIATKYREYGKTFDKRNLKQKLLKYLRKVRKPPGK